MVFGTGAKAGAAIVQHPKIKALSFTGSTGVGKYIQEKSAPFIKKLSLEVFLAVYSTGNLLVELGWKDQKIQSNLAIIPLLSPFGVQTLVSRVPLIRDTTLLIKNSSTLLLL